LKDGDTLPSQDEMARSLGVSRASLREALNRLALMGLIEMRHGKGTYVRTARPHDLMNSLSSLLILDKVSAAELLEARFHVESALAALAALNATDEDLARILQLIVRMEKDPKAQDIDGFVAFDTQLHKAFAQAAKNPVLVKVLEILWSVLPQRIRHITTPEQIPSFFAFHREIYGALERHDPAAARLAMEGHVGFLIELNDHSKVPANPA
jgi:GntR family transcriptional repressor for pyruvate dehydrogenase complex